MKRGVFCNIRYTSIIFVSGTLWFNTYKGAATSFFVNKENYDAVLRFCLLSVNTYY